ncbi:MAG: hypothetical protein PUF50_08795 [Erysipelotrichaceae bacterium]|nr:hypothetical protein [Erysipelotrichaceae bacterium]
MFDKKTSILYNVFGGNMEMISFLIIAFVAIFLIIFVISSLFGSSQRRMEKKLTKMANSLIRVQNSVIQQNEDLLKDTANRSASIQKDAIRTVVHTVKEGWTDSEESTDMIYCKYCGCYVDSDSRYCKNCGAKLRD